jgi:acetyl-CoA C-acetyltransferase
MSTKNKVIIAGIGQIPVGEHWDTSLRSLALRAIRAALADSGNLKPQVLYVGNVLAANLSRQAHVGALLADYAGLVGIDSATIEAGGASGGAALRQGYLSVASGLVDVALVVGIEKFTDIAGSEIDSALTTLTDSDYESIHGLTPTAQAALLTQRYFHEYKVPRYGLAGFPLTAHANGVNNGNSMFCKAITMDSYKDAELVCDPLNLFDVAPAADGAAALILTRPELLPQNHPAPGISIKASSIASDNFSLADRADTLWFSAAQQSAREAFEKADISPEQVDLFEYDDAYPVFAALTLEAAGFAPRGKGWKLASDGSIKLTGQIPCATLGGSKARGNPGGATGVYQAVEAVLQLRGLAGKNQIKDAKIATIQSIGGPASVVVTHILATEA